MRRSWLACTLLMVACAGDAGVSSNPAVDARASAPDGGMTVVTGDARVTGDAVVTSDASVAGDGARTPADAGVTANDAAVMAADAGVMAADAAVVPTGPAYYVATTGSDSHTCVEARDPATPKRNIMGNAGGIACLSTPGERLLIRGGTYRERISNYESPASLPVGTSWTDSFMVAAYPGETVQVDGIAIGSDEVNQTWTLSYWIFDGLVVRGRGIWTREPDHIRFSNIEVDGLQQNEMCVIGGGRAIEFINVHVHDCGDPSIAAGGGSMTPDGIYYSYGFYWTGDDCLFERIQLHDTVGYGFHFFNSSCDTGVRNCPDRNVVRYSQITRTGLRQQSAGLLFSYGDGNQAYGNVIYGNNSGISVGYGVSDTLIQGNTIVANTYDGIGNGSGWGHSPDDSTRILGNIVAGNGGYGINNGAWGTPSGEPTGTTIQNNMLHGNGAGTIHDTGIYSVVSSNLEADPLFVNPTAFDYHLSPGSPAIDTGLCLADTDIDQVRRPQGPHCDVGAYERMP